MQFACQKGSARAKITEEKWDFVVLQEIYNAKPYHFAKYAPLFHEAVQKNGSKTVLFCTASISTLYPKGFQELYDMQVAMGKQLNAPVAAGGKAWLASWGDEPTVEQRQALYDADKAHPGQKGSYIHACTLYAALTGHSPVGLTHRIPKQPEETVTAAEVKRFQEAAWKVHQDVNGAAAGEVRPAPTDAQLRAILEPIRQQADLPALAAAFVNNKGAVAVAAVGVRKKEGDVPATPHDQFHLGSDTKAMTAAMIAVLVEQGKLNWEATLGDTFPEGRE